MNKKLEYMIKNGWFKSFENPTTTEDCWCDDCGVPMCLYTKHTGTNHPYKFVCEECGKKTDALKTKKNLNKRDSSKQIKWRDLVIESNGAKCRICGATENLEAHHLLPFSKCNDEYEYAKYSIGNGIVLCEKCHNAVHIACKTLIYGDTNDN